MIKTSIPCDQNDQNDPTCERTVNYKSANNDNGNTQTLDDYIDDLSRDNNLYLESNSGPICLSRQQLTNLIHRAISQYANTHKCNWDHFVNILNRMNSAEKGSLHSKK